LQPPLLLLLFLPLFLLLLRFLQPPPLLLLFLPLFLVLLRLLI